MVQLSLTQQRIAKIVGLGLFATSLLPTVAAHGQILGVTANGVYNESPNIYWDEDPINDDTVVRVMYEASSTAYNLPSDFSDDSKMACEGASGAPKTLQVSAGSDVNIQWVGATSELLDKAGTGDTPSGENPWVHAMGTVASYIASCTNDDCTTYDASDAEWVKLAMFGIDYSETISDDLRETMAEKPEEYYPTSGTSGLWGMARLVESGSAWNVTIPTGLENGQYILRHELIAIHNPLTSDDSTSGPQAYIGCIQLEVIDGGDLTLPSGTKAGSLYEPDGDFANYNVYSENGQNFVDPGPDLWDWSSSSSSSSSSSTTSSKSSSTSTTVEVAAAATTTTTSVNVAAAATTSTSSENTATTTATAASNSSSSSSTKCRKRSVKRDGDAKVKKSKKRHLRNLKRGSFPHLSH